jgi:hypothetical protein
MNSSGIERVYKYFWTGACVIRDRAVALDQNQNAKIEKIEIGKVRKLEIAKRPVITVVPIFRKCVLAF